MRYNWQNLPKKKTVFTVRATTLKDLDTGKTIRQYSSNTRLDVVQKCTLNNKVYYRTQSAATNNLNWAFEAHDFGLPNEIAPSVPSPNLSKAHSKPIPKQTERQQSSAQDGGARVNKLLNKILSFIKR